MLRLFNNSKVYGIEAVCSAQARVTLTPCLSDRRRRDLRSKGVIVY